MHLGGAEKITCTVLFYFLCLDPCSIITCDVPGELCQVVNGDGKCMCGSASSCSESSSNAPTCDANKSECKCGDVPACDPVSSTSCDASTSECKCGQMH